MKLKNRIALLLVCCLCLSLCACGSNEPKATDGKQGTTAGGTTAGSTAVPGTTEPAASQTMRCGDWTVEVPAGYELKIGDFMDETDTRYFSVRKSNFSYFDFSADGEESIRRHYYYNRETYINEQKDVKGRFGGNEWVGFQYSDGYGGYGVEAYAFVGGEMIRVASAGYDFDSDVLKAVLGSLQYDPSGAPETPETEAPETEIPETLAPETEAPETTEYEPSEGAPVYANVIQMQDVMLGIKEGYTEMRDGLPYMYVMQNDSTGGRVTVQNMSGTAEDRIASVMAGLEYELREENLNGMQWLIAEYDGFYCFGADTGSNSLVFTIDYGGTEKEMQDLMFGVMANQVQ